MRKILCILLILLLAFASISCGSKNENKQQTSDVYKIKNQQAGLNELDFDTTYSICKEMLKRYYEAAICGEALETKQLIQNEKLQQYVDLKLEYGKFEPREDSIVISYGLKDIQWNLDKNCVRLILIAEVTQSESGGFSEEHQFMIYNNKGTLVISDWRSEGLGTPAGLDDVVRKDEKELKEPQFWEYNELSDHILEKAKMLISK